MTVGIKDTQQNLHYYAIADCHILFVVMLSVIMLKIIMLNAIMLSAIMLI